ncbi:MAG TPA: hypothetical protein VJ783_03350 [Pirellulales bacterium]|nr:hypothetical protein [Pirellulales bacterium]
MIWLAAAIGLVGIGLVFYSSTMPYYTDRAAPHRLADELQDVPREVRFRQWYARLPAYETSRKKLSDCGRGCLAASVGLLCAILVWHYYHLWRALRTWPALLALWIGLWMIRVPLENWYYEVRAARHDYPWWGDSMAIPLAGSLIAIVAGAAVSTVLILLLIAGRRLPATLRFVKPASTAEWARAVFVMLWIGCLGWGILLGIPGGDESFVFPEIVAVVVLWVVLNARPAGASSPEGATRLGFRPTPATSAPATRAQGDSFAA